MSQATRTSPARRNLTIRKQAPKITLLDLAEGKVKSKVSAFDDKYESKFRWTPSLAKAAQREGKFILVGFPPAKQKASTTSQKAVSLNPPFVSAKKLETVLDPEKGVKDRYYDDNVLFTTINVGSLVDSFPEYYDRGDIADKDVFAPLYVVGSFNDVAMQLWLQGIIPLDLYNLRGKNNEAPVFDWLDTQITAAAVPQEDADYPSFVEWSKTKEYKDLVLLGEKPKEAKLVNFKQDKILKIAYLKTAKNGALDVLDVNNVRIATFPNPASKSATNDFADYVVAVIKGIWDKSTGETPEALGKDFDDKFAKVAFDISGMKNIRKGKVEKMDQREEGKISTSPKIQVKLDGFAIIIQGETYNLSNKIYSDNKDAIPQLFAEIRNVIMYKEKTGKDHGYAYKQPSVESAGAASIFGHNFAVVYAKQNKKGKEEDTVFIANN